MPERFADDVLCHCSSERQARSLKESLARRLQECGLELHPDKTRIVYCKDDDRRGTYHHTSFDFLGHSFRARRSKNWRGKFFVNFSPAVSNAATKAIREEIRHWQLRYRMDKDIDDLARMFNPIIRGWLNYYGRYYKSALYPTLRYLNRCLAHWAMAKYKRLRRHRRRADHWIGRVVSRDHSLFAHWPMLLGQRLNGKSRMSGDAHVRIRESLGVKLPRATRRLAHCRTKQEAQALKAGLQACFAECRLTLHPKKTKIVYCKDGKRKGTYPNVTFDFLGYQFRPRVVRSSRNNELFCSFSPAVSPSALKAMRSTIRDLNIRQLTQRSLVDIACKLNPLLQGWFAYYGRYNRWALAPMCRHVNLTVLGWARRKFKRFGAHKVRASSVFEKLARTNATLFEHWRIGMAGVFA